MTPPINLSAFPAVLKLLRLFLHRYLNTTLLINESPVERTTRTRLSLSVVIELNGHQQATSVDVLGLEPCASLRRKVRFNSSQHNPIHFELFEFHLPHFLSSFVTLIVTPSPCRILCSQCLPFTVLLRYAWTLTRAHRPEGTSITSSPRKRARRRRRRRRLRLPTNRANE